MSLSKLTFLAFAARGPYPIHGLDYLSTAHLSVTVNGTPASATFDDAKKTMTLTADPAVGATIVVLRTTPRKKEERLTQFLSLPTGQAGLSAALLDQDHLQNLFVAGEARDHVQGITPPVGAMTVNDAGNWAGQSKRVENLSTSTDPADAITKAQLDTVAAAARPLPTSVLDADDGLMVTAAEWDDKAPSGFRTALGLGTSALLTAGSGANQTPTFAAGTPPRYATADGRNINLANHSIQTDINKRAKNTVVRWVSSALASPGVDPASPTWSQNSSTRMTLGGWAASRVEFNNGGGEVDGSAISPYRVRLSAGTWRIRWLFKQIMPLFMSATNYTSFRVTNNDDTSSQVIYYDLGLHRASIDYVGQDYSFFPDSLILSFASADSVVFRFSNRFSGGGNACDFHVLFQLLSTTSVLS